MKDEFTIMKIRCTIIRQQENNVIWVSCCRSTHQYDMVGSKLRQSANVVLRALLNRSDASHTFRDNNERMFRNYVYFIFGKNRKSNWLCLLSKIDHWAKCVRQHTLRLILYLLPMMMRKENHSDLRIKKKNRPNLET